MNTAKKILIGAAAIVAAPFIGALFLKNEYSISRQITINQPRQPVFEYLRHLKNQDAYSKWVNLEPNMKKDFRGTDGTVGFVYAWDGNEEAGAGEQEITGLADGERIDVELRFTRPFEGVAQTPFILEAVSENQTRVTWGMEGNHAYPLNLMNLFMDGMLGPDLETNLGNLKAILEKHPVTQFHN